ncbi:BLUF domain-containing protein [Nocardioides sp. W7]|uniref:BLUF domain-containing protein n=1 Tax=Nocardioides sp. W7 TaxID=2931390 RepID=UPI001FD3FE0F|nr:BLUF domain-containing protein [Nocardioides sp. W7]
MLSLTYLSSATRLMSATQLVELMAAVRPRNVELGLTGLLLYSGGNIIQTLEGPDDAVDRVYGAIRTDPRHTGLIEVLRDPVTERAFPDWSMGFTDVDLDDVDGFNGFLQLPADHAAPGHRHVRTMLRVFKEVNR